MARKPRLYYPGAFYHVIARGNNKQKIFFTDEDKYCFYLFLQEMVARYQCEIHGFCLMDNHVHLIIQVKNVHLSKIMQNLCFRYTQWINKKLNRVGHLFQGRYKAILIEVDFYLLQLIRYIHQNPLRAKIVTHLNDYRWSSHSFFLGNEWLPWVSKQFVLSMFSQHHDKAIKSYMNYVNDFISTPGKELETGNKKDHEVLSSINFYKNLLNIRNITKPKFTLDEIIQYVCKYKNVSLIELSSYSKNKELTHSRAVIAYIAKELNIATYQEIGNKFNRDSTGIIRSVKNLTLDDRTREWVSNLLSQQYSKEMSGCQA